VGFCWMALLSIPFVAWLYWRGAARRYAGMMLS
jgi:hypothetical protein